MVWRTLLPLALAAALLGVACRTPEGQPKRDRPNFLVIVIDDLGYSDLGAYGSEIATPHIDALAESGLRAKAFYVAPDGEPTTAMLLTGVDNHVAGFGASRRRLTPQQEGHPAYSGELNPNVVTVAQLLRGAGYRTVFSGKWELGSSAKNRPYHRGFERTFVLHDGAASHWSDMKSAIPGRDLAHYTRNGEDVESLPDDYFSTRAFTDFAIESIRELHSPESPFFAYVAYQAVHGPLAVPEDWRDRYAGRYDKGYDAIRDARVLRMKSEGLVRDEVVPYPGLPTIPPWSALSEEQRRAQSRKMELYAAMLENLDSNVGRLLDFLREIGEYDDTDIIVISDNGPEASDRGLTGMDPRDRDWYAAQFPESDVELWGGPGTFVEYGPAWAEVSASPFRMFKHTMAEGGIRSPLILTGPGLRRRGSVVANVQLHVMDLAPSILELAGVEHPSSFEGHAVAPIQGRSLVGLGGGLGAFERRRAKRRLAQWLGFAWSGEGAVRDGPWKLVWMPPPLGAGSWRLYRIDLDPSELYDVAASRPDVVEDMRAHWQAYVDANGVIAPRIETADLP